MSDAQEIKIEKLTTQPVARLVCEMAVPTILTMLVSTFYNMADTFFVGRIGTSASAAVGVVFALMAVIQALGFTFGHGSGNYISRQLGKHQTSDAAQMAATAYFSAIIFGIVLMVSGLLFLEPLVTKLGATETIRPFAMEYTRYILLGAPFMLGSIVLNNQLRFQGSASYGMVGMMTGAVLNIALDPILIFGFHMGVAGAALATAVSQMVSMIILLFCASREGNIRIRFREFRPVGRLYKEIVRGGLPSLARQGIFSVATICLNLAAGPYGDAAIAAFSIVSRILNFASSALIGFGQGFQPVCGFNYGAGLYQRVRQAFWFCVKTSFFFLVFLAVIGFVAAPHLVAFMRNDPAVVEIGKMALRMQCITFPLFSWYTMSNMMLQTMGKAGKATLLALARQGLFFIPCILVLAAAFGLLGLELAQPAADLLSFLMAVPLTLTVLSELKNGEEKNEKTGQSKELQCRIEEV